ncbi:MAG: YceH family protein [Acidobacteria bacterium]|nr:YceH family protein [Acidobacteriota bacterium]
MHPILNEFELRVVGSLIEKQIATPAYYPMTLNALTNACNQKNHRDPVVSYDEATVERAIDGLRAKNMAYVFHGSEARVPKYAQQFSKYFELNPSEVAVLCVLILRGPQTPGELRSRTAHLQHFEQLSEIENTLQSLMSRDQPLIARLARQTGARESRYAHLIGGEIDVEEHSEITPNQKQPERDRIGKLEEELSLMRQELEQLKGQFQEFKKQFE